MKNFKIFGILIVLIVGFLIYKSCIQKNDNSNINSDNEIAESGKNNIITINIGEGSYQVNSPDDIKNKEVKEFLEKQIENVKTSDPVTPNTIDRAKTQEMAADLNREKKQLEESNERLEREIESLKKEKENLKDEVEKKAVEDKIKEKEEQKKENEEEIDDIDKAMQTLSSLLKITGYICAITGQYQWAAAAYGAAAILDSTLEASGKEAGKGPEESKAREKSSGYNDFKEDNPNSPIPVPTPIGPTGPVDEEFLSELSQNGWNPTPMGGKFGSYTIVQNNKDFRLYNGKELISTIDYFSINDLAELPISWNKIEVDHNNTIELYYISESKKDGQYLKRERGNWLRYD